MPHCAAWAAALFQGGLHGWVGGSLGQRLVGRQRAADSHCACIHPRPLSIACPTCSCQENVVKECEEEASVPEELAVRARAAGAVSYTSLQVRASGVVQFVALPAVYGAS